MICKVGFARLAAVYFAAVKVRVVRKAHRVSPLWPKSRSWLKSACELYSLLSGCMRWAFCVRYGLPWMMLGGGNDGWAVSLCQQSREG
jgi:hypothetical protein